MSKTIVNKNLTLILEESAEEIRVKWVGRSTERDPSIFLNPILNDLLSKGKKIILDFRKLEYMNSSTVTPVLKVLDRLKKSTDKLLIVYDKNLKWQDLSFSAMEIFKTSDQRIDIQGE